MYSLRVQRTYNCYTNWLWTTNDCKQYHGQQAPNNI